MTLEDHLVGILSTSACFWLIACLYVSLSIERFIVKRYEQETDLLDTVFFKEHATFTKHIPNFFSSAMYTSHLLMCVWGWGIYKNRKMYRDIDNPKAVTRHFSKKEIRKAKWFAISGLIIVAHGIAYYVFRSIWPELFD
jgi:hypothetical protein